MAASITPSGQRLFDPIAATAVLRRLAGRPESPWLHREIARRMAERLDVIRLKPSLVIDWWGGLGGGAGVLAKAYPKARRIVVEPDPAWQAKTTAAMAAPWWSATRWSRSVVEVVLEGQAVTGDAELVWANMILHLVADPPALFECWERMLGVDGFVMFSCLGPGTLREIRALYARRGWPSPTAPFIDMHDLGDMLVHAGFADPVMDQETLTLRYESAEAVLAELQTLGGNTAPDRAPGLRTPGWRRSLLQEIETLRGADGKIGLEFEVAYGHAFKSAPRLRAGEPTTVSLDAMRSMVRSRRTPAGAP